MTKKDLIKKILKLGKELEKANGFDAVMITNDMEIEVDNYVKQLPIHDVVEPKGELVAFCRWYNQAIPSYETTEEEIVETYLRESN